MSQSKVLKQSEIQILLPSLFYLEPYELSNYQGLDHRFLAEPLAASLYIKHLLGSQTVYSSIGDADDHEQFLNKVLSDLISYLKNTEHPHRNEIATYILWFFQASLSLVNSSSQLLYAKLRNELLRICQLITEPHPPALVSFRASSPSPKRIGIVRFGLWDTAEQAQVFHSISDPPPGFEVNLFTLSSSQEEINRVSNSNSWLTGKVFALDASHPVRMANQIREQGIDLLVNTSPLTGRFVNEIALILSLRGARLQAMFTGDVVTSGIPEVDYFLMPERMCPENVGSQFSEKIVLLKGLGSYIPLQPYKCDPAIEEWLGKNTFSGVRLVSNAHVLKLGPELISTWAEILSRIPNSTLALMPFPGLHSRVYEPGLLRTIRRACKQFKVDPARFLILPVRGMDAVRSAISKCDLFVDSFPYAGSISIFDVLAVGVPFVTIKGKLMRSRMGSAIAEELELGPEMVATDLADYQRKIVAIAEDAELRVRLKSRVKQSTASASPAFDSKHSSELFYRAIERIL